MTRVQVLSYDVNYSDRQCRLLERSLRDIFERRAAGSIAGWQIGANRPGSGDGDGGSIGATVEGTDFNAATRCNRPSGRAWQAAYPTRTRFCVSVGGASAHRFV